MLGSTMKDMILLSSSVIQGNPNKLWIPIHIQRENWRLNVLFEECRMVNLTAPYVSGFLAFREVPFLMDAIQRLQKKDQSLMPQVLLVDGNGILHHRGFGVACHIGILTNLPCIGVAKKLLQVDGLKNNDLHKEKIQQLKLGGDTFPLVADSGTILGMALKSHNKSTKPLYVSVGHKVSLGTAVRLIQACCRYRIPEPIRQADIRSREYIRRTPECAKPQPSGQERGHEGMRKKQSPTLSPTRSLEESAGEERPENPSSELHS
ncbi:endonuclease V isoform X2 [Sminthopsis crassicaudata]|uniref:endonuclease V isoform X2 n=1 Tax=Sminthopsis crassicaudata TaxID=9301 RepID=UPI003D69980B